MKTYLKLICGAIFLGGMVAYFFYHDINKEVVALENDETSSLYLFQVGVFTNAANAENFASNYDSSMIYENDSFFRVITCATLKNADKLKKYYDDLQINYFIKKITINKNLQKELENNDELLKKAHEKEAINKICQNELDIFALSLKN